MGSIIGIVILFVMVFGGYVAAGGKLGIILHALPFEMMMIGGAAVGSFMVSNDGHTCKHALKDIKKVFKGGKWKGKDYNDLLSLLFMLLRTADKNPMALEEHIENPTNSGLFNQYPKIVADKTAMAMICDTLRAGTMNYDDPHQVEDMLEKQLEGDLHEGLHSAHALQNMADALPALGIVAAVLGVIKTMAAIDQPPAVLGKMIGGALVGTFLGVFLAYGLVGPFASKVKAIAESDHEFYLLIRNVLVSKLHNHPANICIEVARQSVPKSVRPTFNELEQSLKDMQSNAA
jgi:chemotaxis protein MotA